MDRLQQRDADIAEIQRIFPLAAVQVDERFFMTNPLPDDPRRDANARSALDIGIILHRPGINLIPSPDDTELLWSNVLYLVRVAPLTRQLRPGAWVLTPAGNFFPTLRMMVEERRIDASIYQGQYAAKFGCATTTVKERFTKLISELRGNRFPMQDFAPLYALCISGLLPDFLFLRRMESCMLQMFERRYLLFRQHAEGELYPWNLSSSSETLEFVLSDERSNNIFLLMQRFAGRLDAARRWVRGLVIQLDNLRKEQLVMRRQQLRYVLSEEQLAATDIDKTVPRVDVHELYFSVLEYAAASIDA